MNSASFENCSEECRHTIFSFLDIKTLIRVGTVSKSWAVLSNDSLLWKSFFRQMTPFAARVINLNLSRLDKLKPEELEDMVAKTKLFFSTIKGASLAKAVEAQLVLIDLNASSSLEKVDKYVRQLRDVLVKPIWECENLEGKWVRLEKIAYEYLKCNRLADAKTCMKKISSEDYYVRVVQVVFEKCIEVNDLDSAEEVIVHMKRQSIKDIKKNYRVTLKKISELGANLTSILESRKA